MKKLLHRYMGNYQDRTIATTTASFVINAVSGTGQLALGIYLLSPWFMANAMYYLLLCSARGHALQRYRKAKLIANTEKRYDFEFSVYKHSGILICLSGIAYLLVCLRMHFAGDATVYSGYTVYLVALIAFSKLGTAIHGTIVTRHLKAPIVSTLKVLNFTDACVSIVVTQCTLLTMEHTENAIGYSSIAGMIASGIFILQGIIMLIKKKKYPATEYGQ
ncbi:MAG TPA: hypothetical protein PKA19_07290 [Bacillota bacterium]|nr:hypothetical protein [Bacillota bacterium]